jgi:small subunit ribosomal protein S1
VGAQFFEGGVYPGVVVKVATFGAFVELTRGLQGLVHISKLPGGSPAAGSAIDVRILSIDHEQQRLALVPVADGAAEMAETGQVTGTVTTVMRNGVALQLEDGRSGWLPAAEVDLPAGTVLAQRFRRGRTVTGRILSAQGDRVTMSTRSDSNGEQREWRQHQAQQSQGKGGASFGTFGDLLSGLKLKD